MIPQLLRKIRLELGRANYYGNRIRHLPVAEDNSNDDVLVSMIVVMYQLADQLHFTKL